MKIPYLIILSLWGAFFFSQSTQAEQKKSSVLLHEGFEETLDSGLAKKLLKNRYISLAKGEGRNGSNAIRVAYIGYEHGSQRVVVNYPLGHQVKQATLAFDVRFAKDFQWVLGGKLHGLGPKNPVTGGNKRLPKSWSARVMFASNGRCRTYLYDQSVGKKYGIGHTSPDTVFKKGKWYRVQLQVSLNDVGQSNGYAKILINNKNVAQTKEVTFRGKGGEETLIQSFLFHTFHGGNMPRWAPVNKEGKAITVIAYFDNFQVTEGISP